MDNGQCVALYIKEDATKNCNGPQCKDCLCRGIKLTILYWDSYPNPNPYSSEGEQ